ncbi:DNA replication licensing factor Mcm5-like isoform X3 [Vespa velutina]|nr:DNA replication licensing factor Mcm5-like isoform X3 [Vespa velutina]
MRASTREHEKESEKRLSIPIAVRQLEAVIRISEALARMQLQSFATEIHVNEALRLFQVSTLDAAMSGSLAEHAIYKVIHTMIRCGKLQHRMQQKMYRLY